MVVHDGNGFESLCHLAEVGLVSRYFLLQLKCKFFFPYGVEYFTPRITVVIIFLPDWLRTHLHLITLHFSPLLHVLLNVILTADLVQSSFVMLNVGYVDRLQVPVIA